MSQADEIAHLVIRVDSNVRKTAEDLVVLDQRAVTVDNRFVHLSQTNVNLSQTNNNLSQTNIKLGDTYNQLSSSSERLVGYFNRLITVGAIWRTSVAGFEKLKDTIVIFENFEARLRQATGSIEDGVIALEALKDFDRKSPFTLSQSIDGFLELVNLGLDPSERAMKAFGDAAYALGINIEQMAFKVQRASVGEFRPLRQIGITAKVDGENLRITFRGVTETIKNNAKEIEEWFIKLGESKFANSMAIGMDTLGGSISNLESAWDSMFAQIGKSGASEVMVNVVKRMTIAIDELTVMMASGQIQGYAEAIFERFNNFFGDIRTGFENLSDWVNIAFDYWANEGVASADRISKAFTQMPENIKWAFEQLGSSVGTITNNLEASIKHVNNATDINRSFGLKFSQLGVSGEDTKASEKELASGRYSTAQLNAIREYHKAVFEEDTRFADEMQRIDDVDTKNIIDNLDRKEKAQKDYDDKIKTANEKRSWYDANKVASSAFRDFMGGVLGDYNMGSDNEEASKQSRNEFNRMKESLGSQEEVILQSYKHRGNIIRENTELNSEEQLSMLDDLNRETTEKLQKYLDSLENLYEKDYSESQKALDRKFDAGLSSVEEYLNDSYNLYSNYASKVGNLTVGGLHPTVGASKFGDRSEDEVRISAEDRQFKILENKYEREQRMLEEAHARQGMSTEQYLAESREAWNNYTQDISNISEAGSRLIYMRQLTMQSQVLGMAANIAGQLDQLAQGQGDAAKATFVAIKAISIAQAIVNTELAATRAMAEGGFIAGIPMSVLIRGLGYASVAIMAATSVQEYGQKFAGGGIVPGNSFAGDDVHAQLNSGEMVLNHSQQQNLWRKANGDGGSGGDKITVVINNLAPGTEVVRGKMTQGPDGKMVEMIVRQIKAEMINDADQGGPHSRMLQARTNMVRTGRSA